MLTLVLIYSMISWIKRFSSDLKMFKCNFDTISFYELRNGYDGFPFLQNIEECFQYHPYFTMKIKYL